MNENVKEYYHNLATGNVTIEYTDDSTKNFNMDDVVSTMHPFTKLIFNVSADITEEDKVPGAAYWNSFEDCLDVVQADGSTLQLGLENYIPIKNTTGSIIENGTVVMFSGVNLEETPEATPLAATPELDPLYLIGIATTDIAVEGKGRATIFGKVRNVNTSGLNQGDLLWVHPTLPGKLTNIKPSAPNPAISIAAVLKVHAAEGIILVRPTIYPRAFYGVFKSNQTQVPALANTPYAVSLNSSDFSSGVSVVNNSRITVVHAGLYSFDFRMQVTSSNSSQKNIYIWGRLNGTDVPDSATKVTMLGNAVEVAPSWSFMKEMQAGNYFEIMYAVDDTAVSVSAPTATGFCPSTPSVVLKVNKFDL